MTKIGSAVLRALTWPAAVVLGWLINKGGEGIEAGNLALLDSLEPREDES